MALDILFLFSVICVASLPFARLYWKSQVEECRFGLFEIRDRLVLMVAKGELDINSSIFNHYYTMVNEILRLTEKMHFEGLIRALGSFKTSEAEMAEYRFQLKKLSEEVENAPEGVKKLAEDYYRALIEMLLVNSNFVSALYLYMRDRREIAKRLKVYNLVENHASQVAYACQEIESECEAVGLKTCLVV